ncbi:MAG TPA: hypothetical protein VLV83_20910 [Acidobacteriota bacterium]|nr:hypothetical protein [Acidobacteriota bacterium]
MNVTIDLPEELIKDIQFEAELEELSLDEWMHKTLKRQVWRREAYDRRPSSLNIADFILREVSELPPEELEKGPEDGALEHDHYIYGTPKKYQ